MRCVLVVHKVWQCGQKLSTSVTQKQREARLTLSRSCTLSSQVWHVSFPQQAQHAADSASLQAHSDSATFSPEPSLFFSLFPFHVLLDENLNIQQVWNLNRCGISIDPMMLSTFTCVLNMSGWPCSASLPPDILCPWTSTSRQHFQGKPLTFPGLE